MILRAQPIGHPPARRWIIKNVNDSTTWDGGKFVEDWRGGRKYAHPDDACFDMADILRDFFSGLGKKRTLVVPVEIELYGPATPEEVAQHFYRASILKVSTEEHGNGPGRCLALPAIQWGKIREVSDSSMLPSAKDAQQMDDSKEDR